MPESSSSNVDTTLLGQIEAAAVNAQGLQPDADTIQIWQKAVHAAVDRFYGQLDEQPTYTEFDENNVRATLARAEKENSAAALIALVGQHLSASGLATAGPGHLAFIPGGGLYIGALADHIAATLNCFSADAFAAPFAVAVHEQALQILIRLIGYDEGAWGDICSGGSQATVSAFWAARRARALHPRDYENAVVYLSSHTHHCCAKALEILFGSAIMIRHVPLHGHCIDPQALRVLIQEDIAAGHNPFLLVATAGTTSLGRIDPLDALADIAAEFSIWLHVDAAYGGFFRLCPELAPLFAGIERADSIVLDPHKGLFLPYGIGAVLLKNGAHIHQSKENHGAYLQDRDSAGLRSPMDYSLELTRPFRSLRLWLAWQVHGQSAFENALREKYLLARHLRLALQQDPGIHFVCPTDLSVVAFRLVVADQLLSDRLTRELLQRINRHAEVFLSSTTIDDSFVIRVAILSYRTHLGTIEALARIILGEAHTLRERLR